MNIKKLIGKIKATKNWELYLALMLAAVVLVIVFATSTKVDKSVEDTAQFDEYISSMENKISSVIGKMEGCGNVKVAISYSAVDEKVYAYETVATTSGGVTKQTSSVVMVKGEPLVVKTLPPTISGVVVIADGADNAVTKMKIKQVVVTLLGVSIDKVQVFTYKS